MPRSGLYALVICLNEFRIGEKVRDVSGSHSVFQVIERTDRSERLGQSDWP